jgi:hypothetical protein
MYYSYRKPDNIPEQDEDSKMVIMSHKSKDRQYKKTPW